MLPIWTIDIEPLSFPLSPLKRCAAVGVSFSGIGGVFSKRQNNYQRRGSARGRSVQCAFINKNNLYRRCVVGVILKSELGNLKDIEALVSKNSYCNHFPTDKESTLSTFKGGDRVESHLLKNYSRGVLNI